MWLVSCHHSHLPESLTLHYSRCDSLTESPVTPVANEGLHCSDVDTADCQKSDPLLPTTCMCCTASISASDRQCVASDGGNKPEKMQFVCLEDTSVDAVTNVCASSAAVTDADSDISCESLNTLYQLICKRLHSVEDVGRRHSLCDSLRILLQFFEVEYLVADSSATESTPAFPLELLEQYTQLVKDDVIFYPADGYGDF